MEEAVAMIDTMINTVCVTLWGLGRDRGGVLKPSQVIKTFLEKDSPHETWRPSAPSESRAGPWGSEGGWGGSVQCRQTVIHTHGVSLFTPDP